MSVSCSLFDSGIQGRRVGFSDSGLLGWCILAVDGDLSVVELVEFLVWRICVWIAGMTTPVLSACHSHFEVLRYLCRVQRAVLRWIAY